MKKCTYIFIFVLTVSLLFTLPVNGDALTLYERINPMDPGILTPGYWELNADFPLILATGFWVINNNYGIQSRFSTSTDYSIHLDAILFGKAGPFYGELGLVSDWGSNIIHTGLNGFFPLVGRAGPVFESTNDFNLTCNYENGRLRGGWMWLLGDHSRLTAGGECTYAIDDFSGFIIQKNDMMLEFVFDERVGRFAFNGKTNISLVDFYGLGNHLLMFTGLSGTYMFTNSIGAGTDLYLTYDPLHNRLDPGSCLT